MSEPLALHGGRPARPALLPYGWQAIDEDDVQAALAVLRGGRLTTGPRVAEFERAVAAAVGAAHAVAVSSGTAALHAAAFAAGIGPGDEVIVPALTFAASANAVLYQGGIPVFADVRADTLNVDPADVAARLTGRTRAIVAVDYAGQPADLDAIGALARDRGLALIEDAAHALGAEYRGRRVGALADLTAFSFHPVKHITTGEGGLVTTASRELDARLRRFRNHGLAATGWSWPVSRGSCCRRSLPMSATRGISSPCCSSPSGSAPTGARSWRPSAPRTSASPSTTCRSTGIPTIRPAATGAGSARARSGPSSAS